MLGVAMQEGGFGRQGGEAHFALSMKQGYAVISME